MNQLSAVASPAVARQVVQAAAVNSAQTGSSTIDSILRVLPQFMQMNAQRQLINTNLTRAQQGLPPIPLSSVTPGLNFGLTPGTQNSMLVLGMMGIGAFALVSLLKRR